MAGALFSFDSCFVQRLSIYTAETVRPIGRKKMHRKHHDHSISINNFEFVEASHMKSARKDMWRIHLFQFAVLVAGGWCVYRIAEIISAGIPTS
jgi:hypothetical protein